MASKGPPKNLYIIVKSENLFRKVIPNQVNSWYKLHFWLNLFIWVYSNKTILYQKLTWFLMIMAQNIGFYLGKRGLGRPMEATKSKMNQFNKRISTKLLVIQRLYLNLDDSSQVLTFNKNIKIFGGPLEATKVVIYKNYSCQTVK